MLRLEEVKLAYGHNRLSWWSYQPATPWASTVRAYGLFLYYRRWHGTKYGKVYRLCLGIMPKHGWEY